MENTKAPAFPVHPEIHVPHLEYNGLTKREYFAGLVLQGMMGNSTGMEFIGRQSKDIQDMRKALAAGAISIADELLKQLSE